MQPDKVAAISAFEDIGPMQNLKNNPMHSSRQALTGWTNPQPEIAQEQKRHDSNFG
ncbi:hypothetical protein ACFQZO_14930 [Bradyrhizobium sp. GCM10027634]|uniref:hypothetical protein n=1 Tax=unclassified Bradyrhizobium TaxID=2631580 RepID=UPI00188BECAD|nr:MULTISPECIES: hypothetical protein [unclassified Bradyrhizobium]MDN5002180.1 hypothetical protein [Bradyrhizobium sp. WYCCWR 12677]